MVGTEGPLALLARYDRRRIDDVGAGRLLRHLCTLLEAVPHSLPSAPLGRLPWLTAAERHQVRVEWNDTAVRRRSATLPERLAASAAARPDATALVFEGRHLSFRSLWARARGLAGRLRRLGVGPDVPVAVCQERSLELVVSLLAVLEAGGAYVPLDPEYPADRLTFMLADSGARVVLTDRASRAAVPPGDVHRLEVDRPHAGEEPPGPGPGTHEPAGTAPAPVRAPEHLAYVIYTSGSTGRPKGAMNRHGAILNRLDWMQEEYRLGPHDRVLQKTPVSFDVSVWELFWPLLAGACLVVARPGGHRDPTYLAQVLRREGITTLHFVPSMLRAFLAEPTVGGCTSVRQVMASGEALPAELRDACLARLPGSELHNLYGPTEAAVDVTHWACRAGGGPVPIGRPIANLRTHVLDRDLDPVALGVAGELYLGGAGLARGYHGRPALTAERFLPDPVGSPGDRLYRTGDLARWRDDGSLDFLGRVDFQVKLRGFRIELGEIESALTAHPEVSAAAVAVREEGEEARLVGYVVSAPDAAPTVAALREHLGRSLPEHMVPALWVFLEELPLTASGKLDRRRLPAPSLDRAAGDAPAAPPRDDLERFLAGLWSRVLGVERVARDDDFFALGGSSLGGAMVVNSIQEALGEIVHVVAIFDAPTVAAMADHLRRRHAAAVATRWGVAVESGSAEERRPVDEARLVEVQDLVPPPPPLPAEAPNPPAVFILSPPRSGSTLLRVMLAGNPALFAPPELELLPFNTLAQRTAAFAGREAYRLEGLVRATMEAIGGEVEEVRARLEDLERSDTTIAGFYALLQRWIGGRLLVDKTPGYAFDRAVLERAEAMFDGALYVHLLRHPYGMVRSFEEAQADEIFFRYEHGAEPRELGEILWTLSHRNILAFLEDVPAERHHRLRFEDLVEDPEHHLRRLCGFLGVEYDAAMADPYGAPAGRMTDGLHAQSRMLGDVKFHTHRQVDASVADRWRTAWDEDFLGEPTWRLAHSLRYTESIAGDGPVPLGRPPGEPLRLSPGQEGLWHLYRLRPRSAAFNLGMAVELGGSLHRPALDAAVAGLLDRHEILRSRYVDGADGPRQVIRSRLALDAVLRWIDLTALSPQASSAVEAELVRAEASRPFDLEAGPVIRLTLVRRQEDDHLALITLHHIAGDGWSLRILLHELAALYEAAQSGMPSPLERPVLGFTDYAEWLQRRLEGGAGDRHLAFWRRHLEGPPEALRLPTDRPRDPDRPRRGGIVRRSLPAGLVERVEELARAQRVTPFMVLLAVYQVLLGNLSGQEDFVVGVDFAGRDRRVLEGVVGLFARNLPLRAVLRDDPRFLDVLERARETARGALRYQAISAERVFAAAGLSRQGSTEGWVQARLNVQDRPEEPLQVADLDIRPVDRGRRSAQAELTVNLVHRPGELHAALEYDADLFDRTTAERWTGELEDVLELATAQPAATLSKLARELAARRRDRLAESTRSKVDVDAGGGFSPRRRKGVTVR